MDETLFPECVPQACHDCPAMEAVILDWRSLNKVRDLAIEANSSMTDEEIVSTFSDDEIEHASRASGEYCNPANAEDRVKFAKFLRTLSSEIYHAMGEAVEEIEVELSRKAYVCQSKGPLKVRVPVESGKVLATFCKADLKLAPPDHQYPTSVKITKDS